MFYYAYICYFSFRFESFNLNVWNYNVHGNRLAPSRDIAMCFCILQHLRYICHGGSERYTCKQKVHHIMAMLVMNKTCDNCIHRCGGALKDLRSSAFVQHVIRGISLLKLHADRVIYQPGTPRKVVSKCMHCCIVMQRCSFRLGMQESHVHSV